MVNGTLLNFGKRYENNLRVIFDQWPKLHLGLDGLSNQKILKGVYKSRYSQYRNAFFIRILLSPWRTQVVRMINEFLEISSSEKKQRSFHSEYTFAHLPHFLTATYFTYHLIYGHYHVSTSKKRRRRKKEEKMSQ